MKLNNPISSWAKFEKQIRKRAKKMGERKKNGGGKGRELRGERESEAGPAKKIVPAPALREQTQGEEPGAGREEE